MKVVFLGSFLPKESENEIRTMSIGAIANANNALQWSYIMGLKFFYPSLEVISLPQIGAFPVRYKKPFFKPENNRFYVDEKTLGYSMKFLNIIGLKHLHRFLQTKKILTKVISQSSDNEIVVICYDLHPPFLKAVKSIKKKRTKIKTCIIVPDLHGMTGAPESVLHKLFQAIESSILRKSYEAIDLFVLLSKHMVEKLPIMDKPYLIIEGIYNIDDEVTLDKIETFENIKYLFYSGALDSRNGIINLIEAFHLIPNSNYRLIICGDGEEKEYVVESSKQDQRIIYKGQLPRNEVLNLQRSSTLLINPRTAEGVFSRYSFPSKTIEYFASGVPVLMYELEGVPSEYYSFCYTLTRNSVSELKDKIVMICEQDSTVLKNIGNSARQFVIDNKSAKQQCNKLVKFINENTFTN